MARIVVVGGSLGGLFAANVLHRDGHDVTVLEKARGSLDGRGAGIVSHDALERALRRAGLQVDASLGVPVPGRVMLAQNGSIEALLDMPQILTSWSRLYQLLRDAFPVERYIPDAAVTGITQQAERVLVHANAEGLVRQWECDILIASDGIRSTVRQCCFPDAQPRYAGYVAWRGVCDEAVLSKHMRDTLFPRFGFCMTEAEHVTGYPIAGQDNNLAPGKRGYNYVWYRRTPTGQALDELMTDADGVHYPQGIPPQLVSWRQVSRMRRDAERLLAPQFAEAIEKSALPFFQPIFDLHSDQIASGRVAIMGDAAFVARPHIGMGVTKAAEDALALSDLLREYGATPEALQAYQRIRQPVGAEAVRRARWLGGYIEQASDSPVPQAVQIADSAERSRLTLHETAIDLELYGHLSAFNG